jgi:hypothetical protein
MPRVHFVKKARKDNPVVKKGESYYWWKFYRSSKSYSTTPPKRWELTRSVFLRTLWQLEDLTIPQVANESDADELIDELEMLIEQCEESLENMPEALRDTSESGELLQERIDGLYGWIEQIRDIDWQSTSAEEAVQIIEGENPF